MARWGLVLVAAVASGCGEDAPSAAPEEQPANEEAAAEPGVPDRPAARAAEASEELPSPPPEDEPREDPRVAPVASGPPSPAPPATESGRASETDDPIAHCRELMARRDGSYTDCICQDLEARIELHRAAGDHPATFQHLEGYMRRHCPPAGGWGRTPHEPGDYPPHVPTRQPARDDHPHGPLDRDPRLH